MMTNRRAFLAQSASAVALASSYNLLPAQSLGANNRVNVAVAGLGGRGQKSLLKGLSKMSNVNVIALCDPDIDKMDKSSEMAPDAKKVQDYRKVLEMKELDALVIAAPNHWHAAMAISAAQAGKHAYVEKPVSHGIWEGRQMCEARKKYNRVMQAGTQQLSCPAVHECGEDIRSGKYGKVKWIHCFKLHNRKPVGKRSTPLEIPDTIDYNLWAGPAPADPIYRDKLHYDWHWDLRWGDGEMGNWAVHYTSDLCSMLGWDVMPNSVLSAGGRFLWDDAADAPNMLFSMMEYQGIPLTVEIRDLPVAKGKKSKGAYQGAREGNIIMCENGLIKIARGGGRVFSPDGNEELKKYKGNGGKGHMENFIDAIRADDHSKLNAPIEGCHVSSGICHLSTISYQLGNQSSEDEVRSRMADYEDIKNTVDEQLKQLKANESDLSELKLGPKLTFDSKAETFTGDNASKANELLRHDMRSEFEIPDKV